MAVTVLTFTAATVSPGSATAGTASTPESNGAMDNGSGEIGDDRGHTSATGAASDALVARGLLGGSECGPGLLICPDEPIPRSLLAVWLVRALDSADPGPVGATRFEDVDAEAWWAPFVERLFELRVTRGCAADPLRYCPAAAVTRAQAATFLVRAFDLEAAGDEGFVDIAGSFHAEDINATTAAGITAGCASGPARYCPDDPVTRSEMADLLVRALERAAPPAEARFSEVAVGMSHSCGLRTDDTIACWGNDWAGRADAPTGAFSAVTVGVEHSCGLRADRAIVCWGDNREGQAEAPAGAFSAVSAGGWHTCGMRVDDTITCWGNSYQAQTDAPAGAFTAVAAGGWHTCGLRTDRTVVCWGNDEHGRSDPPAGAFSALAAGRSHSCGLRTDRTVVCWGRDLFGQTGAPPGEFDAVAAGQSHSCGLRADRAIVCWGDNYQGQTDAPAGQFLDVSVGGSHSCGLRTDRTIACWGPTGGMPLLS